MGRRETHDGVARSRVAERHRGVGAVAECIARLAERGTRADLGHDAVPVEGHLADGAQVAVDVAGVLEGYGRRRQQLASCAPLSPEPDVGVQARVGEARRAGPGPADDQPARPQVLRCRGAVDERPVAEARLGARVHAQPAVPAGQCHAHRGGLAIGIGAAQRRDLSPDGDGAWLGPDGGDQRNEDEGDEGTHDQAARTDSTTGAGGSGPTWGAEGAGMRGVPVAARWATSSASVAAICSPAVPSP